MTANRHTSTPATSSTLSTVLKFSSTDMTVLPRSATPRPRTIPCVRAFFLPARAAMSAFCSRSNQVRESTDLACTYLSTSANSAGGM